MKHQVCVPAVDIQALGPMMSWCNEACGAPAYSEYSVYRSMWDWEADPQGNISPDAIDLLFSFRDEETMSLFILRWL